MHVFDGKECAEVYLYASRSRELAKALTERADESLTLKVAP